MPSWETATGATSPDGGIGGAAAPAISTTTAPGKAARRAARSSAVGAPLNNTWPTELTSWRRWAPDTTRAAASAGVSPHAPARRRATTAHMRSGSKAASVVTLAALPDPASRIAW